MNPDIASIHERMAKGGDWRAFQQEISRLVTEARNQEEYVTLLEAHRNLLAVADECFPPETASEIRRIGEGEYKLFLNQEAMEGGRINPIMLDRVTAREVAAGRLAPDDEFRKFAEAGGSVLGDSADLDYDRRLAGLAAFAGLIIGALVFFGISKVLGLTVFALGMAVGFVINERRRKQALQGAHISRIERGYH